MSNEPQGADIKQLIVAALSEHAYLTARELQTITGHDKSPINSVLYKYSEIFKKSDDQRPKWSLRQTDEAPESKILPSAVVRHARISFELYEWQREALDAWIQNGKRGIVEAVTGAGKTRLALAAISDHLSSAGKVAIVVPTIGLQEQWHMEVGKHFTDIKIGLLGGGSKGSLKTCDLLIAVANAAGMYDLGLSEDVVGLLVADECHHFAPPSFRRALEDHFDFRLGITATIERPDGGHWTVLAQYFGPVVFKIGYKRALADGIIARVRVATIGVKLRSDEQFLYDELTEQIGNSYGVLVNRFGLRGEPYQEFMEAVHKLAKDGTMQQGMAANRYIGGVTKRLALLCETPAKLEVLALLAPVIKNSQGTFLFTQTIKGAEDATEYLRNLGVNAVVIHAELSAGERKSVFELFSSGAVEAIASVHLLAQGIDVPEADFAIILAASKTRRQMIQRMGRILRPKADGRAARFAITYVRGTGEDPASGAHSAFLNEVLEVADETADFSASDDFDGLDDFLNP